MSKGARAHTLAHGAWCIAMSLCLRARAILLVNAHRREGGKSCRGGCGLRKIDRIPQSRPKRRTGLMLRSRLVQQARREAERSSQHFRSAEERRECESSEHLRRRHPVSIAARAPPVPPAPTGVRASARGSRAGWVTGHLLTFLHFFVSVHLVSASARHRAPALNPPPLLYVGPSTLSTSVCDNQDQVANTPRAATRAARAKARLSALRYLQRAKTLSSLRRRRDRRLRVGEGDVADGDGHLLFHEGARLALLHGLHVLGANVDALDEDLLLLHVDREKLAHRALRIRTKRRATRVRCGNVCLRSHWAATRDGWLRCPPATTGRRFPRTQQKQAASENAACRAHPALLAAPLGGHASSILVS